MKTLELVKGLTDKEHRQVSTLLAGKKRKTLSLLFNYLVKWKGENYPERKALYEKVFDDKYSKAKDYLLRNELRLLNEELYAFYATVTFQKYLTEHEGAMEYWLCRAFYERRMKKLFIAEADDAVSKSERFITNQLTTFSQYSSAMYSLKSLWLIDNQTRNEENLKAQMDLAQQWMDELKKRFVYTAMEILARKDYIRANLKRVALTNHDYTVGENDFEDIDFKAVFENDWYANYLHLKRKVYSTTGVERIDLLKQMNVIQEKPEFVAVFGYNPQTVNYNNLGLEYVALGRAEEAAGYFKLVMELSERHNLINNPAYVQNYLVTLILQGKYTEALDLYERKKMQVIDSRSMDLINIHRAFAYLFLKDTDMATNVLPRASDVSKQASLVMMRYVFVIAFIIRKDYDLAVNELQNLRRVAKNSAEDTPRQDEIAELFHLYLKEISGKKTTGPILTTKQVKASWEKYYRWALTDLHLWWLMKKINTL